MLKQKKIRPPLKWAGGKYQILERIKERLPDGQRLIEPFVGSGVVFLNTDFDRYILNDINSDLITFYKTLKKENKSFIEYAKKLFTEKTNTEKKFYDFRDEFNSTEDQKLKSALFLYINKHDYNGLIRYNASGELNVPFGRYKKPYFPEKEMLHFISKSRKVTFRNVDFEKAMRSAKPGDVIYCDPPYVPLSNTANFTSYSAGGFDENEQARLASLAEELSENSITILISNHYTKFTKKAYENAEIYTFPVRRLISCNGAKRNHITEVLAVYKGRSSRGR